MVSSVAFRAAVASLTERSDFSAMAWINSDLFMGISFFVYTLLILAQNRRFGKKILRECNMVYSDVAQNGWVLPYKKLYSMRDFHRLRKEHDAKTARFILLCSAAHYSIDEKLKCDVSRSLMDVDKFIVMDMMS